VGLTARLRGAFYDAAIVKMTAGWYRAVPEGLPSGGGRRDLLRCRPGVVTTPGYTIRDAWPSGVVIETLRRHYAAWVLCPAQNPRGHI